MAAGACHVHICVRGQLDPSWSEWFEGLAVRPLDTGDTCLSGSVADQPALHGLLAKIRDLGLPLLALRVEEPDSAGTLHLESAAPDEGT